MPKLKFKKPLPEVTRWRTVGAGSASILMPRAFIIELFHDLVGKLAHARISSIRVANYDIDGELNKLRASIAHELLEKVRRWAKVKALKNNRTQNLDKYFFHYLQRTVIRTDWQDDSDSFGCPIYGHDFVSRNSSANPLRFGLEDLSAGVSTHLDRTTRIATRGTANTKAVKAIRTKRKTNRMKGKTRHGGKQFPVLDAAPRIDFYSCEGVVKFDIPSFIETTASPRLGPNVKIDFTPPPTANDFSEWEPIERMQSCMMPKKIRDRIAASCQPVRRKIEKGYYFVE